MSYTITDIAKGWGLLVIMAVAMVNPSISLAVVNPTGKTHSQESLVLCNNGVIEANFVGLCATGWAEGEIVEGGDNPASAQFYVRTDGGTYAQCDGLTNAPYTGGSSNCAVKHLFELLDPEAGAVRISGGDIVNIADGSYEMGMHGDYTSGDCNSAFNYNCYMPSIPGGIAGKPTKIRGGTSDACTSSASVELWGSGRATNIVSITNSDYVELSCLTITDHSSCITASGYPDSGLVCDRSAPYNKPFADNGLRITNANNITLRDLDIKGLSKGVFAGGLGGVTTIERVNLFANHFVGWDGDIGAGSSNTGTLNFVDSNIMFSGCGDIYDPGQPGHGDPHACAKQDVGGYGDGLGTVATAGDWVFDNTNFLYNNSDGIDLLYKTLGGSITVKNSRFEGNGGNQIKTSGDADIYNNLIIGNCAWNSRQAASLGANGENCRALGTAIVTQYTHTDSTVNVLNNTIISEGDCALSAGDRTGVGASAQSLNYVNNIIYGRVDYLQNFENSCNLYEEATWPNKQIHNNIVHKPKSFGTPCTTFQGNIPSGEFGSVCTDAGTSPYYDNTDYTVVSNPRIQEVDMGIVHSAYDIATILSELNNPILINSGSPAANVGYEGTVGGLAIPTTDINGNPRTGQTDIGALESGY